MALVGRLAVVQAVQLEMAVLTLTVVLEWVAIPAVDLIPGPGNTNNLVALPGVLQEELLEAVPVVLLDLVVYHGLSKTANKLWEFQEVLQVAT